MLAGIRLISEPFAAPYMQRALLAVLLLSVLAGVVGVVVHLRRLSFLTDALTHTVFPGVAIAFFTDNSVFAGALIAAVASAALLTLVTRSARVDDDAFLALVLATFFSVGVVVVSRNESFTSDLNELLFGRLLTVTDRQLVETALVTAAALVPLVLLRKEILLRAFNESAAVALGYPVWLLDLIQNVIVALVVVAAVRAVGTALVVAFVITPAAIARLLCSNVRTMVLVAVLTGAIGGWLGLAVSFDASVHHDVRLASAPTIVVVLTAMFAIVVVAQALRRVAVRRGLRRHAEHQGSPA
ncbi:MAG TPA: metal ABC transporter permease [Acidimicrobiales bacterium]